MPSMSGFWSELKRRKVLRVAVFYGGGGWIVVEGASVIFPAVGVPDQALTIIVVLFIVGFPLALLLGWRYDLTPRGIERTGYASQRATEGSRGSSELTRMLVIPFRVLRPGEVTDFLGFSLPDAITCSLAEAGGIAVQSDLVGARYAGPTLDPAVIARETGAGAMLTGTILQAGPDVRVTAQLSQLPSGTVLWTQTTEASDEDLFQLQDQLARRILDSLRVTLTGLGAEAGGRDVPKSTKGYAAYLRGNQLSYQVGHWSEALKQYIEALKEDPSYAPAHARLARCYRLLGKYAGSQRDELRYMTLAEASFRQALALNEDLDLAHSLFAQLEVDLGRSREAMIRVLERVERHGATSADLYAALVTALRFGGLLEESLAAHREATAIDPTMNTSVGHTLWMMGRYEEAKANTGGDVGYLAGVSLAALGRTAEAIESLREGEENAGQERAEIYIRSLRTALEGRREESLEALRRGTLTGDGEAVYYLARTYAFLGERDLALAELQRALDLGFFCPITLEADAWLEPYLGDSEFQALLAQAREGSERAAAAFQATGALRGADAA